MPHGVSEFSERMKERTMSFAETVLALVDRLPRTPAGRVIAYQLADSATAVASNYRATCNARSRREFVAKLGIVVEEADESACWLELVQRRKMLPTTEIRPVLTEALEVRNIMGKSLGTARANLRQSNRPVNQLTR
jgi:four helix bundle protein